MKLFPGEKVPKTVAPHILAIFFLNIAVQSFLVFKNISVSYFQLCASLGLQEDANGCAGREKMDQTQEKDWDTTISREYAKGRAEMVTYLALLLVRQPKTPTVNSFYPLLIFSSEQLLIDIFHSRHFEWPYQDEHRCNKCQTMAQFHRPSQSWQWISI